MRNIRERGLTLRCQDGILTLRTMPKAWQILSDASDHAEGLSTDTAVSGR